MKLICKTTFGSHLYGTSGPNSDLDIRGIFLPEDKDILLGRIPKTNKESSDATLDYELYSLHHFVKLACEGQTLAFDMLWTPASQITLGNYSHIWHDLVMHRHKFLSKNMNAFIGYARNQANKYSLKGERLNKLEEFLCAISSCEDMTLLGYLWNDLPKDTERTNGQGIQELQIAGKWFGATTEVRFVRQAIENRIDKYGSRAALSARDGGIDWKAMSHSVRVCIELEELLTSGEIKFPLKDAWRILEIKQGKYNLEFVQDILDTLFKNIEDLTAKSSLPEKVDREFWDNWLYKTIGSELGYL